jgi:hypothetical protein
MMNLVHSISRRLLAATCFVLLAAGLKGVASEIVFRGFLVSGGAVHVILIDEASGRSSGWIEIGERFDDYTVVRYEASTESLIVTTGREERSLVLKGGAKNTASVPTFRIGSREFQIYSDAVERSGSQVVFRGRVTGISAGAHFSCEELTVDVAREEMMLVGTVRFQQGSAIAKAHHLRVGR